MLTKKNRVWGIVALLTIAIGFSSCLKSKNDFTASRPTASIWFMNVSNISVDPLFYDNDQKVSDSTIFYNFYSRYYVYGGLHKFELRKKGSDSVIVTNTTNYDSTAYYNFLVYGSPARALAVKSDFTGVDLSKINIRFLHLSQDAGPVDVYVGNEKIDSNRTMLQNPSSEESTRFKQFTSFSVSDKIVIKAAGTETILANNASLLIDYLTYGNVYTIYLYGSKASTGTDKLAVNAYYSYW